MYQTSAVFELEKSGTADRICEFHVSQTILPEAKRASGSIILPETYTSAATEHNFSWTSDFPRDYSNEVSNKPLPFNFHINPDSELLVRVSNGTKEIENCN